MIPIIEFQQRSLTGPVMKADEFDLEFSMKVRELVAKYDIRYNPEEIVVDDVTADHIFQAGVELLAEIGIYHVDTGKGSVHNRISNINGCSPYDTLCRRTRSCRGRVVHGAGTVVCPRGDDRGDGDMSRTGQTRRYQAKGRHAQ